MWRGRLPHWRADDEVYYVTFRHRRELDQTEMGLLFSGFMRPEGTTWSLFCLAVGPEETHIIFRMLPKGDLVPELSKKIEAVKTKVGRKIIKASGEKFPPFYTESYDRIIRDEAEFEEKLATFGDAAEGWLVYADESKKFAAD